LLPTPTALPAVLKEVIDTMRDDSIGQLVRSDTLILTVGMKFIERHPKSDKEAARTVREKMRQLAKLIQLMQVPTLAQALKVKK
jgi:hypothetical protein